MNDDHAQPAPAGPPPRHDLDQAREDLELLLAEVLLTVFEEEADVLPEAWPLDAADAGDHAVALLAVHDDASGADLGVQVRVSAALGRLLAGRMFACDEPTGEDLLDAVGELGNIVGGNVKSLLFTHPGHARLSLPSAVLGGPEASTLPGAAAPITIRALVLGEPAELTLLPDVDAGALFWPPTVRPEVLEAQP